LKALSGSRSGEGGKKTPIAHCHFASLELLFGPALQRSWRAEKLLERDSYSAFVVAMWANY
jgi:hypothetical protein